MSGIGSPLSLLALVLGIAHAVYVYRQEVAEFRSAPPGHLIEIRLRASYYALWTLVLWAVLGAYIVVYWLLAIVPYLAAKAMGKTVSANPGVETAR